MARVQVDPAVKALEARERELLRAQMADPAIMAEFDHISSEFGLTPEQRAAKRAALEVRTVKQVMRRAKEMERLTTAPVQHGLGEFLDASVAPAAVPKAKKAKKPTVEKFSLDTI